MTIQPFIKRGVRSNATARRLIAATTIAPHVMESTIEYASEKSIVPCRGRMEQSPWQIGNVTLQPGQRFHLVASRVVQGRYYVVTLVDGIYQCSATDSRVVARCVASVQAYKVGSLKKAA